MAKVTAAGAGRYAAYLEGKTVAVDAGDYYLRGGERAEAPGRWVLGPAGSAALGVDVGGPVDAEAFRALMAVRHPGSGAALRRVGGSGEAVAAIDATFSAPKSVSVVWALSSPELRDAIEAAQERAVDRALGHAVEFVPMVRRRVDRETVVRECPVEVLATSWRHTTARAVGGRPPDPQLHSHVVLHGAVREGDGRVVAIESRAWLVHQREIGAAYRAELAVELGRLGFQIERGSGRGGRYFEIAGVPGGLCEQWSARHHQVREAIDARLAQKRAELERVIAAGEPGQAAGAAARLEALDRSGQLMPAEQRAVAVSSRAAKDDLVTTGDLDRAWWQAARDHDFDARSVELLRAHGRVAELEDEVFDQRIAGRLVEFNATFSPREARAVALEAGAGGSVERALAALGRLHDRGEILDLADGRQTTRAHRGLERQAVASAGELAAGRGPAIAGGLVDREVETLGVELFPALLAGEQEQAIRAACSGEQLVVVVGQAGTGKSTALVGVARAHQAAGRVVLVTSTGGQAAERLAGELGERGVQAAGYSTAALKASVEHGRVVLGPHVTVLHDEAALASTREQGWLLAKAAESGACLVEVGDPRQSQAVGAGGLWPAIEQAARDRDAYVELARIVRAKDPADRRDQALWRAGQHQRALEGYAERGRVHVDPDQGRSEDLALEGAHADRRAGRTALVVCQTSNDQLDALNARAQALRAQDGELGEHGVALERRPYALRGGDELVVRAPVVHPELGPVRNGTRGRVLDVAAGGESAIVRLSDGRQGVWGRGALDAGQVRLAYVSHSFPAQGQTADRTHVIADRLADAEGTYVALTRGREQTHLYASTQRLDLDQGADPGQQIARLAERLGRSEPQVPSIAVPLAHEQRVSVEHARETLPADTGPPVAIAADAPRVAQPDTAAAVRDELDRIRSERDRLAAIVASKPHDPGEWAAQGAEKHRQDAQYAGARAEQLASQWESLSRFARFGERGKQVKSSLADAQQRHQHAISKAQSLTEQAAELAAAPGGPLEWDAQHPGVREQHQAASDAYDAALDRHAATAIEQPAEHLTRVLGDRPPLEAAATRDAWNDAAITIERYRLNYTIDPAEPTALGVHPEARGPRGRDQLRDWRHAGKTILDSREQLGHGRGRGSVEERMEQIEGIVGYELTPHDAAFPTPGRPGDRAAPEQNASRANARRQGRDRGIGR